MANNTFFGMTDEQMKQRISYSTEYWFSAPDIVKDTIEKGVMADELPDFNSSYWNPVRKELKYNEHAFFGAFMDFRLMHNINHGFITLDC